MESYIYDGENMKSYLLIFLSIFLGSIAQISLKMGTMKLSNLNIEKIVFVSYITNVPIILGLIFYGVSALIWIIAISNIQLSVAYPMVALGYIFVFYLSHLILGEIITTTRIIGLLVIVIGVIIIAKS